jgi:hypothetical protein
MEVPCSISEALLIWHVERPMNIGALLQEIDDAEKRSLDCHVIRLHRSGRNGAYRRGQIVTYSVVQLAKKQ